MMGVWGPVWGHELGFFLHRLGFFLEKTVIYHSGPNMVADSQVLHEYLLIKWILQLKMRDKTEKRAEIIFLNLLADSLHITQN